MPLSPSSASNPAGSVGPPWPDEERQTHWISVLQPGGTRRLKSFGMSETTNAMWSAKFDVATLASVLYAQIASSRGRVPRGRVSPTLIAMVDSRPIALLSVSGSSDLPITRSVAYVSEQLRLLLITQSPDSCRTFPSNSPVFESYTSPEDRPITTL